MTRAWLLVPLLFSAVQCVHFFGMIVTDLILREHHYRDGADEPYRAQVLGDRHSTLLTLARIPVDYGLLCLGFLLLGWLPGFLALYSVMALASTGYLLLAARRWFRQVQGYRPAVATGLLHHSERTRRSSVEEVCSVYGK